MTQYSSFSGIVIEGKRLGRTIGFPTANIRVRDGDIYPATYGVSILLDGKEYFGVGAHLMNTDVFEVHIFDFIDDIYGKMISITPLWKIRENQKFPSLEDLTEQIKRDKKSMLTWIEKNKDSA